MIERALRKLQAAQPKPGDALPHAGRSPVSISETNRTPEPNADLQRENANVMKSTGSPTLGLGADWQGMPQMHQEIRAYGETVIDLGNVSGAVQIDLSQAGVWKMTVTGPTTIEVNVIDWPYDAYPRSTDGNRKTGIDLSASLLINKQFGSLDVDVDHWAPAHEAPNFGPNGFYEIGVAACRVGSNLTVRGYPVIRPAD